MNDIEALEDRNSKASGQRLVLITLFAVILIDAMGVSLIYPILPSLFLKADGLLGPTVSTASRDFWYAFSLSIFPVGMFLGMPIIGSLSDRYGRKKMMMFCLLGTVAGYLICMAGIGFTMKWLFFAGRFVSGLCASSSAIAMAAIADISEGTEDEVGKMGWPMVAQLGGFIIGPLIAGFGVNGKSNSVSQFMIPFIIASGLAVANAVLLQVAFKETRCETGHRMSLLEGFKEFKFIFVDKRVRLLAFLYLFIQVGIQDFLQGVSLIMAQQFNYTSTQLSIFFAVTGAATALAVIVVQPLIDRLSAAGRLADASEKERRFASRLGIEPTTFWFCMITGVMLALLSVMSYEALYYICAMLVGGLSTLIGMRFIAVFSSAVAPEEQGKVMGGVGAVLALSIVIASNDIGEFMKFSHNLLLLVAGATVLIPTLFVRRPIRRALEAGEEPGEAPACAGT
jgi:DHA1 family tetracycline resistance protein-like MFS transporter